MSDFYLAIDIDINVDDDGSNNNNDDDDSNNNNNNNNDDTSSQPSISVLEKPFHFH